MAAPMKWTCEMESLLIEEITERRQLWDNKNKLRKLKQASYEEIATKMSQLFPECPELFTMATIIAKFANLKTVYQRNKKKLQYLPSGSGSAGFALPWTHFQQMQFLEDVEAVEPSTSNLDVSCEGSQISLQEYSEVEMPAEQPLQFDEFADEPSELLSDVLPRPVLSRKRKKSSPETELLIKACETLNNVATAQISSEDALGQYIAQKLKSIKDPSKKNAAEADLVNTLMKYM